MTETSALQLNGPASQTPSLLNVTDLTVEFAARSGTSVVVDEVSFALDRGRTLGLVGESGSGKSVTALSIMGLLGDPPQCRTSGSVRLDGEEILQVPRSKHTSPLGNSIAMIFQEPRRCLDPSFTVGDQIADIAMAHLGQTKREAHQRAVELLHRVGIVSPQLRVHDYPHQLSGGMCQRVMIAMAIVGSPKALIADEPTTALDVTVQAQVLDLLQELQDELGLAILFITHDLGVVAEMCDDVAVMYAGQIVETGQAAALFSTPHHPYTAGLLESLPQTSGRAERLTAIPGEVPAPDQWPTGCRFAGRCGYATSLCADEQPELVVASDHFARCHYAPDLALRGIT